VTTCSPLTGVAFVSGNPAKIEEARRLVGSGLETVALDLPEIQSLDLGEVLAAKGEEAFRRLGRPLIVEETGLELAALGGFPGPLVKWMLAACGPDGLARAALALGDPRATARCALLYRSGERHLAVEGMVAGHLVLPPRGKAGFGWDPVFRPDGSAKTFGEMSADEKHALSHRARAWRSLIEALAALAP
jgi:non-canonical purine NTP pyrophosphatase (RdgB/HAM1 family)